MFRCPLAAIEDELDESGRKTGIFYFLPWPVLTIMTKIITLEAKGSFNSGAKPFSNIMEVYRS